ncbi:MAG: ATP-binding cassette domain-containing protein [Alphaproteobacteria bacterium]|nr:ATP-binding cassette domain-containing protein [Alphaproteobacteria bacterium]
MSHAALPTPLLYLTQQLKHYKIQITLAVLAVFMAAGAVISGGYSLGLLVNEGIQADPFYDIPLVWMGCSIFILALASFTRSYYASWLGGKIVYTLRQRLFDKMIYLDIDYYDNTNVSDMVQKFIDDQNFIETYIARSASVLLRNCFLFLGSLSMMIVSTPTLLGQTVLLLTAVSMPIMMIARRSKKMTALLANKIKALTHILDETFLGIKTVQAFTKEDYFTQKFGEHNKKLFASYERYVFLKSVFAFFIIILMGVFMGFTGYFGLQKIYTTELSHGQLASFIYFAIVLSACLSSFPELTSDSKKFLATLEKLQHLEGQTSSLVISETPKKLPTKKRGILAIHNVSFAYPAHQKHKVLENITLSLAPGEKLALVGPSGAGKSTLFSLLLRFYDPQSGTIHFEGLDLKDLSLSELRQAIAIVPQEPDLFHASIYDNLMYANPSASTDVIDHAIDAVRLDEVFEKLPNGRDTLIGQRGVRLSTGQKQRVSIARALIKQPRLLLLDEATSNLDLISEQAIQKALSHLMGRCSSITIAHRLNTVISSDNIAVLENGKIRALGTHAELITKDDLYRQLIALQFERHKGIG